MSPEFSIKFLPPNLLKYVQDFPMIFVFVPFALAGIYVFLKDVDKREDLIFLGAASGIIFLPYMVHCATYVRRDYLAFQTMILFPVLIIMAGVVTSFLREEFSESPIEKIIAISLGLAVIIISVSFYGSAYDINRPDRAREDIYHGETRDILPKNSTIIVPLLEPRKTLEFYGYRAYDFSGKEVIKECFHEADNRTEKKRCVNLESLGVEPEEGLYIWVSNTYMRGWDKVEHIISAYSFKEIKRGDYFHIYKLENASEDMR